MIDERLEWAHQDRMRSASRDRSTPPSPFNETSPFHAEFARDAGTLLRAIGKHKCKCCPTPKWFDTEDDLRYAIDVTGLQTPRNILTPW